MLSLRSHCCHFMLINSEVKVAQSCLTLCNPMDCTVCGILQDRILGWISFLSPGDLPNPGIELRSPTLQVDSLPAEPQGKPKDTGVGSLVVEVVEVDPGIKLAERNRVEQESS